MSEAEALNKDEKENFGSQLSKLEARGMLSVAEQAKIAAMNAELFGHSNGKQKIKHIEKIKTDNLALQMVNLHQQLTIE